LWAVAAAIASVAASIAALALIAPEALRGATEALSDNASIYGLLSIPTVAAEIAVLYLAVKIRGWRATEYLGLVVPSRREAIIGLACLAAFALGYDLLTYLLDQDVVTQFQTEAYSSAREEGSLLLLWIAFVIVAPIGEEVMFRGFLYRGWAEKPRDVTVGILLISAVWASLHSQYDWYGILQIFLMGVLIGWIRWRSGSTLLTMVLHALINVWAMIQTMAVIEWS
jgi:membrane protease YdiL (CAAX protease family)